MKIIKYIILLILPPIILFSCSKPEYKVKIVEYSPDKNLIAILSEWDDKAGVIGETQYNISIQDAHDKSNKVKVFSGSNAFKTSLNWYNNHVLIIEFCNGRGIETNSRYTIETNKQDYDIIIQDIRMDNIRLFNKVYCNKN